MRSAMQDRMPFESVLYRIPIIVSQLTINTAPHTQFKLQDESEQFLAEITRQLEVSGADSSGEAASGKAAPAE